MHERHALTRLRERHGIEITREELVAFDRLLASDAGRRDWTLCRYVQPAPEDRSVWQINLRPYFGMAVWVTVVYAARHKSIVTALPIPLNVPPREAARLMAKHYRKKSKAKAAGLEPVSPSLTKAVA